MKGNVMTRALEYGSEGFYSQIGYMNKMSIENRSIEAFNMKEAFLFAQNVICY